MRPEKIHSKARETFVQESIEKHGKHLWVENIGSVRYNIIAVCRR